MEKHIESILAWLWRAQPPAAIEAKARLVVLDTVGCVVAAGREPKARAFAAQLAAFDPGPIRVPGFKESLSAGAASALFAAAACWHEACEGLARAHGRPGVPVIAACAALAQARGSTLQELLRAVIAGYEIGGRLGEVMRIVQGMHVDATWPVFGVATAAARLSGGSAAQALGAVRAAACQMPYSLYLPVKAGAEIRNTYLAHAAQLGLLAAPAALAGMTSPAGGIDELLSLFSRLKGESKSEKPLAPAGEWLLAECYLKPFAAVRHVHYGAAAALALRPKLAGRLERIARIELSTYAEALTYCGNRAPVAPVQAQFSLSYGAACALVTGELVPESYGLLENPLIRKIESRIVVTEDESLTKAGRRGARLVVEADGENFEHRVDQVAGDPAAPMTREAILEKFARYAAGPAEEGARFLDAPSGERANELLAALSPS